MNAAPPPGPVPGLFDRTLRLIALAGIYGALLAPVVVLPTFTVCPYVFSKTLLLQATIALTVPAFLLLVWRQPALRPRRSWLSIALGAYFIALSLSCVFAFHRHRAFWGSQSRMLGLFSLAHFFVWYVMATSLLRTWSDWRRLLHWQVALGFFVALAALYDLRDPNISRIAGVLGNPIYCATYQVFIIGILALLWIRSVRLALRTLYAVGAIVSLITLLLTGSRGALLGFVSGLALVALVWTISDRRWRYLIAMVGGLLLACAGYALIKWKGASWLPHPALQRLFATNVDEMRPRIWSMAFAGFRDHPLLGWGLGNFEVVVDAHFLPRAFGGFPGEAELDTADSLLFEHISTVGALGTLAFAALWITLALSLRRAFRQGWIEARAAWVLLGLSAAYLVQGQFITDSPSSHSLLFLLLAVGCAAGFPEFAVKTLPAAHRLTARSAGLASWAMVALQAGGVMLAWHWSIQPALASHAIMASQDAMVRGGCGPLLEGARRAAATSTPWPEDHLFVFGSNLEEIVERDRLKSCPQWRDIYDLTRQKTVEAYAGQLEHMRGAERLAWLTFGLGLKSHDPVLLDEAQRLYEALIAGSPRRQLYRYKFATLLVNTGRVQEADDQLAQAVAADPEIGDSLWMLGVLRWQYEKQSKVGSRMLVQAADGRYRHRLVSLSEAGLLAKAFLVQGDLEGLRSMERRMEELPGSDPQLATVYVSVARLQEEAGLAVERNRMLHIAARRDTQVSAHMAPLFDGRVRTIAEAERLTTPITLPSR